MTSMRNSETRYKLKRIRERKNLQSSKMNRRDHWKSLWVRWRWIHLESSKMCRSLPQALAKWPMSKRISHHYLNPKSSLPSNRMTSSNPSGSNSRKSASTSVASLTKRTCSSSKGLLLLKKVAKTSKKSYRKSTEANIVLKIGQTQILEVKELKG